MPKRVLQGTVVSAAGAKTVVVRVERRVKHRMHKKFILIAFALVLLVTAAVVGTALGRVQDGGDSEIAVTIQESDQGDTSGVAQIGSNTIGDDEGLVVAKAKKKATKKKAKRKAKRSLCPEASPAGGIPPCGVHKKK